MGKVQPNRPRSASRKASGPKRITVTITEARRRLSSLIDELGPSGVAEITRDGEVVGYVSGEGLVPGAGAPVLPKPAPEEILAAIRETQALAKEAGLKRSDITRAIKEVRAERLAEALQLGRELAIKYDITEREIAAELKALRRERKCKSS